MDSCIKIVNRRSERGGSLASGWLLGTLVRAGAGEFSSVPGRPSEALTSSDLDFRFDSKPST